MKIKSLFVHSALCLSLLSACEQEQPEPLDFYFCTTSSVGDEQWALYVDDDLMGILPSVATVPSCSTTAALPSLLHVVLPQGHHRFEAKDALGEVRSAGYFSFKENERVRKSSVGGRKGGCSGAWSCDIVIMSFFEWGT
jgi:hypothetical protein